MQYEEFVSTLSEELRRQSGGMFTVSEEEIQKNNGVRKQALLLRGEDSPLSPTIYPEELFQNTSYSRSIPEIAGEIVALFERCGSEGSPLPRGFFHDYSAAASHIYCKLVNRKKNEDRLEELPYECWQDLAVTYYYQPETPFSDYHVQISRHNLEKWEIEERRLRQDAWRNTLRQKPACMKKLQDVLLGYREGVPGEEPLPDSSLLVLTNKEGVNGAVTILYPNQIEQIHSELESGFYMIPCSVHECLILPDSGEYQQGDLDRMVQEVNESQLRPEEVLSDHVYKF